MVQPSASLIFKLDQDDRNLDAYRLQAWFNNYAEEEQPKVIHTSENRQKKELATVIDDILHKKVLGKLAVCRDAFTIEFFLPKELLFEPVDQWILDADINETLGNCYKLVIRSCERFEEDKLLNRLRNYWLPNTYQSVPNDVIYRVEQDKIGKTRSQLEARKLFFALKFVPDQFSLFKFIQYGVPFLLWTRISSNGAEEIAAELDRLLNCCATLENLPEELRKERLRIVEDELDQSSMMFNLSLLWDDPNKIPPFSELPPHYTAPTLP